MESGHNHLEEENVLYQPTDHKIITSEMYQFKKYLEDLTHQKFESYQDLHGFSVDHKNHFWQEIFNYFQVEYSGSLNPALSDDGFKTYSWFPNVQLNFCKNLLSRGIEGDVAIVSHLENGSFREFTYGDLRKHVQSFSEYLKNSPDIQFSSGDVFAAFMPNIYETALSMLSATALGGTFTSTSSDFGVKGVLDRFSVSAPKVLIAQIGQEYGGKYFDLTEKIRDIEKSLPSVKKLILVDLYQKGVDLSQFNNAVLLEDILKRSPLNNSQQFFLELENYPFSHPLYIMYSSGTTGAPKCIVHGAGGVLLQHIKELGLHTNFSRSKAMMFYTTCGWMMWNWQISGLFFGGRIVLYEGSPAYPSPKDFLNIIDRHQIQFWGTSPKFLKVLEDLKTSYREDVGLDKSFPSLEGIISTGSPLLKEQYFYVYEHLKKDVSLHSISGGTDIIGCFMLGNPMGPIYAGEIEVLGLGMDVSALNDSGERVLGVEGELVCAQTFPSRPLYFLNDPGDQKFQEAYFLKVPGMWHHGDFVKIIPREYGHSVIVYGRSDATLNPGGVRIGTAEIYRQTETLPYIEDSLAVGRNFHGDVDVILFLMMKQGEELTDERKKEIKFLIKKNTTPRHVPKEIYSVKDIPYTRSGKKVELAVTRIINGRENTHLDALRNPECLTEYKNFQTIREN